MCALRKYVKGILYVGFVRSDHLSVSQATGGMANFLSMRIATSLQVCAFQCIVLIVTPLFTMANNTNFSQTPRPSTIAKT